MPRQGIMLCVPFEEKRLNKWSSPFIVQPKLDGERCRAIKRDTGDWVLLSSEENIISSVPHINDELLSLHVPPGTELDGELYTHGLSFQEIHSLVSRKVNMRSDASKIQYHIFDEPSLQEIQIVRTSTLITRAVDWRTDSIKLVPSEIARNFDEIMEAFDRFVGEAYEGIIIRHHSAPYVRKRSTLVMKFKPKQQDIYIIDGYEEAVEGEMMIVKGKGFKNPTAGRPKGMLGSLRLRNLEGNIFKVGSGFTEDQRIKLWIIRGDLPGLKCIVKYQHKTDRGVPRFPIFLSIPSLNF